tara:strand:+ start:89185 stop:89706 length:522 start_codon:yes stop_codon:yes gene_type:complete
MKNVLLVLLLACAVTTLNAQDNRQQKVIDQLAAIHLMIERSPIDSVKVRYPKMIRETGLPSAELDLPDGRYRGESPADDFDYQHVVEFEVQAGKIVRLDYDEVHQDGRGKEGDEAYCKKMSITGTTPAIAYPVYEKALLETNKLDELDAVSGASFSLYRFKLSVAYALVNGTL